MRRPPVPIDYRPYRRGRLASTVRGSASRTIRTPNGTGGRRPTREQPDPIASGRRIGPSCPVNDRVLGTRPGLTRSRSVGRQLSSRRRRSVEAPDIGRRSRAAFPMARSRRSLDDADRPTVPVHRVSTPGSYRSLTSGSCSSSRDDSNVSRSSASSRAESSMISSAVRHHSIALPSSSV